ncbi:MAG: hypothetical protein J7L44_02990 [Candidatus Diapherotrites archaeon]|nr:hypothetical protein [Candidatus Diapherotrites archaeon]
MRRAFILLFILLFSFPVYALRYSLGDHYITVEIDKEGNAKITERFYIAFKTQRDIEEFAQKKTELGTDIDEWSRFNPAFTIHIGNKEKLKSLSISFVTVRDYYLEIAYELKNKIVRPIDERSRMIIYETNKWAFSPFIQGSDYVIPENTFITFVLPPESTVIEEGELFNYATIEKGPRPRIRLRGFLAVGSFSFRYISWKAIAPQFSISLAIKQFVEGSDRTTLFIFLAVLAVIAFIIYLARKRIASKITGFVISNTEFTPIEQ